jgi:voltage-gated potassium channel
VLVSLTVRQLTGGRVRIVAAVREDENAPLLKQSGAHNVVVSSATAGRLLGLSTSAPPLTEVVEDLLTPGAGMALAMRSAVRAEVGRSPRDLDDLVIALYRHGHIHSLAMPESAAIETGDMLIYVRDDGPTATP